MSTATIEIPEHTLRLAQERAAQRGLSLLDFVTEAIVASRVPEEGEYRPLDTSRLHPDTIAAMEDADAGRVKGFDSIEELFRYLHSDEEDDDEETPAQQSL